VPPRSFFLNIEKFTWYASVRINKIPTPTLGAYARALATTVARSRAKLTVVKRSDAPWYILTPRKEKEPDTRSWVPAKAAAGALGECGEARNTCI
jgi:hypothetical protein